MKRIPSLAIIGLSLVVLLVSISGPTVLAATAKSTNTSVGQALEIAPPIMTLTANPGQALKTQIELRDITKSNLVVTNEIDDFVANGEDGTPKILTGNDSNNPFSLKNWIAPLPAFTLSPNQIETLPITISVPRNASPGGHYGVIRFTGIPPQLQGTGVSLSASLGALVLLTVSGNLKHQVSVTEFAATKNGKKGSLFQSTPVNFIVKLQNNGNVQEEPTGQIIVTDMFGKTVGGINVNVPPRNILPASIRQFTGALDDSVIGNKKLFGLYHAKLELNYGDSNNKQIIDNISFWIIPYELIGIILLLLVIAFFIIKGWLKRYRRRIVNQTQQRTQKKHATKRRRM